MGRFEPTGPADVPELEYAVVSRSWGVLRGADDRVVVIDNVDGGLSSASLAMAVTAGQVTDRLLGSTKMIVEDIPTGAAPQ